ncbi:hypothetical protein PSPO01_09369 [Paraphaeosphaeria sporulosa]
MSITTQPRLFGIKPTPTVYPRPDPHSIMVSSAGTTENIPDDRSFAWISALYGPGNLICWAFLILSVLVSWSINPSCTKETITKGFIVVLTFPIVAVGHFVHRVIPHMRRKGDGKTLRLQDTRYGNLHVSPRQFDVNCGDGPSKPPEWELDCDAVKRAAADRDAYCVFWLGAPSLGQASSNADLLSRTSDVFACGGSYAASGELRTCCVAWELTVDVGGWLGRPEGVPLDKRDLREEWGSSCGSQVMSVALDDGNPGEPTDQQVGSWIQRYRRRRMQAWPQAAAGAATRDDTATLERSVDARKSPHEASIRHVLH